MKTIFRVPRYPTCTTEVNLKHRRYYLETPDGHDYITALCTAENEQEAAFILTAVMAQDGGAGPCPHPEQNF